MCQTSYLHFSSHILIQFSKFQTIKTGGKELGHASAQRWAGPRGIPGGVGEEKVKKKEKGKRKEKGRARGGLGLHGPCSHGMGNGWPGGVVSSTSMKRTVAEKNGGVARAYRWEAGARRPPGRVVEFWWRAGEAWQRPSPPPHMSPAWRWHRPPVALGEERGRFRAG
jgi:hypothetical protein